MWILLLNDMRSSNIETLREVARGPSKDALKAFVEREKVEVYRDGQWGKSYRQGGPLEWFNPPLGYHDDSAHFVDVDAWRAGCVAVIESTVAGLYALPEVA